MKLNSVGKTLLTMKTLDPDGFTSKFYQSFNLFYQGTNTIPEHKEETVPTPFVKLSYS